MMSSMTSVEIQAWLKANFPKENERHEWKEWRSLKSNISGRKGEDLVSYVSAIANMDGGCIVIGVQDKTLTATGIHDFADYTSENVVHRILGKTPGLPSVGLRVEVLVASDTGATIWLVHVPRHTPRQPVQAHDKAWQREGDSLVELRPERREAILREPLAGEDWSAGIVPLASLDDLDEEALKRAREQYAAKHQREKWASEIPQWTHLQFLDKARLAQHGQLTRAALLLLGKAERAIALLSPNPVEITWKLPDERVAEHFHPPFLLATTKVAERIRNPNIKLFPSNELLAMEMPRYDPKLLLEALHNAVAHQDYEQSGRIVVEEWVGRLRITNRGGFIEGKPEDYFLEDHTPELYRNDRLTKAMNLIGMIDKSGFGIREMVKTQRRRFLPLPDYEGSTELKTVFNIHGQTIDENYTQLLMTQHELPLEHALWLDRVQKKLPLEAGHITELRKAKLIEGRKPNFFVSVSVAQRTGAETEYVLNKGFGDDECKDWIIKRLKLSPATGAELAKVILGKLPAVLSEKEKETKIKNLRTALRLRGYLGTQIEIDPSGPARGPRAVWRIKRN
jgi:ATP-dependent DNA helicase RecG